MTLCGLVLARNEAPTVERTLRSLSGLCDEIVFVDGSSTDGTIDIAKRYANKVFIRQPCSIVELERMFALSKTNCDWVLYLDGDEYLSRGLRCNVHKMIQRQDVSAFGIVEDLVYKGRVLSWGYFRRNYQVRLYRKKAATYLGIVHEAPKIDGLLANVDYPIIHLSKEPWCPIPHRTKRWLKIRAAQTKLSQSRLRYLLYCFFDGGKNLYRFFLVDKACNDGLVGIELNMKLVLYLFMEKLYIALMSSGEQKQ